MKEDSLDSASVLRSIVLLTLALSSISFPARAQVQEAESRESFDHLRQSVVYLQGSAPRTQKIGGIVHEIGIRKPGEERFSPLTEKTSGTGFLLRDSTALYLVTAEHIARKLLYNPTITRSDENSRPLNLNLTDFAEVQWHYHEVADVAVALLVPPDSLEERLLARAASIEFLPDSLISPVSELPLAVIGFPLGLGVGARFSPLRRETNAASGLVDLPRFDTRKIATFFILQDPSIGGYSGAPVFAIEAHMFGSTILKGVASTGCLGLIHGTYSDDTGGKLAAVVPAGYIRDVISQIQ